MNFSHVRCVGVLGAVSLGLWVSDARSNSIDPSDCNLDFTTSYNRGNQVCVTGDVDSVPPGEVCGGGFIYVFPGGWADPTFDISNPDHIPNYVTTCLGAGAFIDESVWLPVLVPGSYGLFLDEHPFGGGPGVEDIVHDHAFTVTNAPIVFSVDPAAIKHAAEEGLEMAHGIENLALWLEIIEHAGVAAEWALHFGLAGGAAGIILGVVCISTHTPCPTSYNGAVIAIGSRILEGIAHAQIKHYAGIIADPPDPNFGVVVAPALDDILELGGPFTPGADHPIPNTQASISSLMGIQASAYAALLPTLEKVQGAQIAGDHEGLLIQAEKLEAQLQLAIDAGDEIDAQLDVLEAHLHQSGGLGQSADVQPIIDSIAAGISDADRATLHSYGATDAQIDEAIDELMDTPVPDEVSWDALIANGRGMVDSMRPALIDLQAQAAAVRAENEPLTLRIRPVASITGAPTGSVGVSMNLTASSTHTDPNAVVTHAWDSDGDGDFDDGTASTLAYLPTGPGRTLVTVRASDGTHDDYATHAIEVAVSNVPPALVNVTPGDYAPFAAVGEVITFHAEATDADGDAVTLRWLVDDAEQAMGTDLDYSMPDEEPHTVHVIAADDDPYSPDAEARFTVRASKWEDGIAGSGGGSGGPSGSGGSSGSRDGESSGACACVAAGAPSPATPYLAIAVAALLAAFISRRGRVSS